MYNTLPNITELDRLMWELNHKLDPNHRGFAELEDLQTLVGEQVSDKRTRLTLQTLIADNCEYKNSDSVFYSPILSLPPPYFKYGNELDSLDLIQKLATELKTLDSHQQGFVPASLFKEICDRLRLKVKIVDDFIEQMAPNMVDVNVTSNCLNVGLIDYVVLIRKLMMSLPKARQLPVQQQDHHQLQTTQPQLHHVETLKIQVRIESAMRLKNPLNAHEPPNSFVRVQSPFDGSICNI